MADPLTILLLAAAAGGAYLLLHEDAALAAQPTFDDAALSECTDVIDGVRVFKSAFASKIKAFLATQAVQPVQVSGTLPPGMLLEVVSPDKAQNGTNAGASCQDAVGFGLVVFASLSLCLMHDASPKLLLIVSKDKRSSVLPNGKFAVLSEQSAAATGVPVPASPPFDAGMPSDVVEMVNAALSDPNLDPAALDAMAAKLDAEGYPLAAKALRDRARALRLKQELADDKAGGTPFTIRATPQGDAADLPYNVARFYTGDGNRWREIVAVNSQLGMIVKDSQWGPIPDPWKAGLTVLLPLSWEARGKGLPPPSKEIGTPARKGVVDVGPVTIVNGSPSPPATTPE
jgi:hypothetical protein